MFLYPSETSGGDTAVTLRSIILITIACGTVLAFAVTSTGQEEIKKKRGQLQKLKKDIDEYEKKIKDREKKEHATLELLDTYDRQAILLKRLVAKMHEQETSLQQDIDSTRKTIHSLANQFEFLNQQYARYAASVYRHGRTYDLELLLASKSFNQLLLRGEYLRRFSEQQKRDIDHIGSQKDAYEEQNDLLQRQLAEQRDIIAEKAREEATLLLKMKKRKSLLSEIRRDKKNYRKEMGRKLDAAKEMEQLIARLIEEDRARRAREKAISRERSPSPAGAFDANRGHLRWPVGQGKVVGRFGNQENPSLHTVTQNPGIDIAVPSGTNVQAVTDGEVSLISWLPSYGNLVILNHQNGFRTVYSHLSDINVDEGEQVNEGDRLGTSGEALSGPMLHFEIWKDRYKLDPEQWLRVHGLSRR